MLNVLILSVPLSFIYRTHPIYIHAIQHVVMGDPWGEWTMDNIRNGAGWGGGERGAKLWVSCVFNALFTIYALYTMNQGESVCMREKRKTFLLHFSLLKYEILC
jgi:hypothetical protein